MAEVNQPMPKSFAIEPWLSDHRFEVAAKHRLSGLYVGCEVYTHIGERTITRTAPRTRMAMAWLDDSPLR